MTLVLKAVGANWPNAPLLRRDSIVSNGTLYCFDTADRLWCNSYPTPNGQIANSAQIGDLVEGGVAWASISPASSANFVNNDAAGIRIVADDGTNIAIAAPSNTLYDVAGKDFAACVWYRQPTGVASTEDNQMLLGCIETDFNTGCFSITLNGRYPRIGVRAVGEKYLAQGNLDTIYQVGFARHNGFLKCFVNGVQVSTDLMPGPVQANGAARDAIGKNSNVGVANSLDGFRGDVFRWWKEDLTVSGANPATQFAKDYEANASRFS